MLTPEKLDAWFEQTAEEQYTRELLFSTVFDLMSQVVCGIRSSMHAAYQAKISEVIAVAQTSIAYSNDFLEGEDFTEVSESWNHDLSNQWYEQT